MWEILSYILSVEATGLVSKFDRSQYKKKGNNLITTNSKKEATDYTIHNIYQIKANLRKNMSMFFGQNIGRNFPGVSHKQTTLCCIKSNILNILKQEPITSRIWFILVEI